MNIRIGFSSDILDAVARLPKAQQKKVNKFLVDFQKNPKGSGLNFERINGAADDRLRSVRIDQTYRAIIKQPESGNLYLVVWVDHHDAAYDWAARKKVIVNPDTGGIQVFTASHGVEEKTPADVAPSQPQLFGDLRDRELKRLGVPEELLSLVTGFRSQTDLLDNEENLPRDAFEALFFVSDGESYDDVVRSLDREAEAAEVDTEDFEAALKRPESQRQFVLVEDDLELQEMLNAPLEKWRVFLHPSQHRIVAMNANGPMRVLGGAGTGKTVVAMHRAKRLVEEIFSEPSDRVLFTTFTKNLAADIGANLRAICSPSAFQRLEVVNFDRWVASQLKAVDVDYAMAYGKSVDEAWSDVLAGIQEDSEYPPSFYREEFYGVVLAGGIENRRDYLTVSRIGRGRALNRRARADIWPVFEEYRDRLRTRGLKEPEDAYRDLRSILKESGRVLPYRAVVVDEAQDMSAEAMRLIRQIIPQESENDLFIVGDAHQRIYGYPIVMSHCGINIRGRSRRLRINYRTPEEVRNWAVGLLQGVSIDDLDGGTDTLKGYRSLIHGLDPDVRHYPDFKHEIDSIVEHIEQFSDEDRRRVCLVARTQQRLAQYQGALEARGIETYAISRSIAEDRSKPGVRLATMHRVKGIEFDHMIVASVNDELLPLKAAFASSEDQVERRNAETRERSLLYVAATRAKKSLLVTSFGTRSRFLLEA